MKLKRIFAQGKMNMDIDERFIPDGQYPYAENIRVTDTDDGNLGALQNVKGNKKLTNLGLTNAVTIGAFADAKNQKIYWCITSDEKDLVMEYDVITKSTTMVLGSTAKTGVLKFNRNNLITGMIKLVNEDQSKDLLLFTDDVTFIKCVNIERAKTYAFDGFEEEDICLIKKPPRYAPTVQPTYTDTTLENNIENKFIQFGYRYKYLDGEYSAVSSLTNVSFFPKPFDLDYQTLENNGMINTFNAVEIFFNTGDRRVTDIELIFKENNSNNYYIIEKFNKALENWGDNQEESFLFSNNKIFAVLPESELYRTFDNVPLTGKALEIIGNRLVIGNYVEGYDLVDINGNNLKLDYDLDLVNNEITGIALPFTSNLSNLSLDLSGIPLSNGSRLSFFISIYETTYNNGKYEYSFDYILTKKYNSVSELVTDEDFIFFIENVVTNSFAANYSAVPPVNSTVKIINKFTCSYNSSTLILNAPSIVYTINGTSPTEETSVWKFNPTSEFFYKKNSVDSSLKTNRSYEVGFIYIDKFGRKTTTLTEPYNTIYVPQKHSTTQNKIKIKVNHLPPSFADRYKIVVKQNKGQYQTIYSNIFYEDGLYRWVLLEGVNKDKVKEGDTLIVKSDTNGVVDYIVKTKVLEVSEKPKDFLEDNVDANNNPIKELSGLYMKIKPNNFNMDYKDNSFKQVEAFDSDEDSPTITLSFGTFPIVGGARVSVKIESWERDKSDGYWSYETDVIASENYTTFQELFEAQIKNTKSFKDFNDEHVTYEFLDGGNTWRLYSREGGYGWNGDRRFSGKVTIQNFSVIVFETEAEDITSDIFFETEQTFDIVDGKHQGNLNNQTISTPAEIELDFFNCYVQGNGVESYQYKDSFNANFLNIDTKPSAVSISGYKRVRRFADLTYSDPYVENNNLNGLNSFNLAKANFKDDIEKQWGSIQKIRSRNSDLLVFQEKKISYVMYGKDLLMNADGTSNVTSISDVLGRQIPYTGEYGIGLVPESHSFNGFYDYCASPHNGSILRLAMDGINEISDYGMNSFFRDMFKDDFTGRYVGGFDPYHNTYVFSKSEAIKNVPKTINCSSSFSEKISGEFILNVDYGEGIGDCGFSFTSDKVIKIITTYDNSVVNTTTAASGSIIINKTKSIPKITTISILTDEASVIVTPTCPVEQKGTVKMIVINENPDAVGYNYYNTYRWSKDNNYSPYQNVSGILKLGVNSFSTFFGTKGVGSIPLNLSEIEMIVNDDSYFNNSGKIYYYVSNNNYSESELSTITSGMIPVTKTVMNNISSGNFDLSSYEYLYLIYKYELPPKAIDDSVSVEIGQSVTINVLNNDEDNGNSPVTLEIISNPIYGSVSINPNNTITYTHNGNANFNTDVFKYRFIDSKGNVSNTAFVNINITNNPPVANNDSAFLQNNSSVTIDVKQNDFYSQNRTISVYVVDNPINGNIVINGNGTITYTHNGSSSTNDSFTYKINDGLSDSNIATVNITIGEVFTFDADYAVLTYEFTDGTDLDTRTRIVTPDISMNTYLGYAKGLCFPPDSSWSKTNIPTNAVIDWSGDNTGTGFESILINIDKLKEQFPTMTDLAVDLRCGWWGNSGNNPVNVKAVFYKGGQMIKGAQPFQYTNPTAISSLEVTSASKGITMMFGGNAALIGERLGVFKYNVETKVGYFDLNDVITPIV